MEGILGLLRSRYAVKRFAGPVEDWKVEKIIEAVRLSPSSFNIQPWRIIVIKGGDRKRLRELSFGQEQIETASHILCFLADEDALSSAEPHVREWALKQGEKCWLEKQVYLALGIAIVQAEALGVGACPMEGFDPDGWRRELGIPERYRPIVLLALGKKPGPASEKSRHDNITLSWV